MRVDRHVAVRTAPKSRDSKVSGGWVDRAASGVASGRLESLKRHFACVSVLEDFVRSQIRYENVARLVNALPRWQVEVWVLERSHQPTLRVRVHGHVAAVATNVQQVVTQRLRRHPRSTVRSV